MYHKVFILYFYQALDEPTSQIVSIFVLIFFAFHDEIIAYRNKYNNKNRTVRTKIIMTKITLRKGLKMIDAMESKVDNFLPLTFQLFVTTGVDFRNLYLLCK